MNENVIIVGAFHEIIELCENCGFTIAGIIDNNHTKEYYGIPIIGCDQDAGCLYQKYPSSKIVITPDLPSIRRRLFELYSQIGFEFATVISPKAIISCSAKIGKGTVVQSGVNVSSGTVVGEFVKLNVGANVMHDNTIGDFVTIAPNAVLLGYVNVESAVYVGSNSTVLPHIRIGSESTIGAGAVVTHNVSYGCKVTGIPARPLT